MSAGGLPGRHGRGRARPVRVPVRLPAESHANQWLRSLRLSGFSLLVLTLIVLFFLVLAPGLRIYLEQRQQIADLQATVAAQEANVVRLKSERARWDDPAYIRAQARDRLFYVMPGEYPYLIIDDTAPASPAATAPVSAGLSTTKVDWTKALLTSAFGAALSTAPPPAVSGQ